MWTRRVSVNHKTVARRWRCILPSGFRRFSRRGRRQNEFDNEVGCEREEFLLLPDVSLPPRMHDPSGVGRAVSAAGQFEAGG